MVVVVVLLPVLVVVLAVVLVVVVDIKKTPQRGQRTAPRGRKMPPCGGLGYYTGRRPPPRTPL